MPVHITIMLYSIIFLFGIVIGSFLNVCIYRIPKKESLIPGSHCMDCGHKLYWYDLFPVFSYLLLKGRCRYCGSRIAKQYPLVELFNGVFYMVVFMANGYNLGSIFYCLMTSALLVLSVIDERTYEIPLGVNLFLLVIGILFSVWDRTNLVSHLIGLVCVSLPLYLLFLVTGGRAIGGGDIKLMAVCGLILGWKNIVLAFFIACILGSVIHVIRMKVSHAEHMLAMGPYLAMGVWITALFGNAMIDWYMSLLL